MFFGSIELPGGHQISQIVTWSVFIYIRFRPTCITNGFLSSRVANLWLPIVVMLSRLVNNLPAHPSVVGWMHPPDRNGTLLHFRRANLLARLWEPVECVKKRNMATREIQQGQVTNVNTSSIYVGPFLWSVRLIVKDQGFNPLRCCIGGAILFNTVQCVGMKKASTTTAAMELSERRWSSNHVIRARLQCL